MEGAGNRYIVYPAGKPGANRDLWFKVWGLGDLHLGNKGCAKDKLREDIEAIRQDPNSFWVGLGDYGDYISISDFKRFDAETFDPEILTLADIGNLGGAMKDAIGKLLEPIRHKCLGLCMGNHEFKYMTQREQNDMHSRLCESLGVPNLWYSSMFYLRFVRRPSRKPFAPRLENNWMDDHEADNGDHFDSFKVLVHHGGGGAATAGGKINMIRRAVALSSADITMVGHLHEALAKPEPLLDLDPSGKKIVERKRMAIMTGSYLKTYATGQAGYGERALYAPSTIGATWVAINPCARRIKSEIEA